MDLNLDFGKKKPAAPELDPVAENMKGIDSIKRRLAALEKGQLELEKDMDASESSMNLSIEDFEKTLKLHREETELLKKELKEFIQTVSSFVRDLQATAKTEDLERLNRAIDYWTPESWVSKNEIIKITEEILDENKTNP